MSSNPAFERPPDGDASRAPALLAVSIVFGLLATVSTLLRLGVRFMSRKLGWDDAMIAVAILLLIAQTVFTGLAVRAGDGRHEYYLTIPQVQEALKWNYVTEILLFLIIPFTKISICLFVARIKNTGWLRWLLRGIIAGLVITTIVPFVVLFVQCHPIDAFWDKDAGTCLSPQILNDVNYVQVGKSFATSLLFRKCVLIMLAYSIASDCMCSFLPVVILWKVQMRQRLKVAIWGLMSLGLVCVISLSSSIAADSPSATACAAVRMSLFVEDLGTDLTCRSLLQTGNTQEDRLNESSGNRSLISIWCWYANSKLQSA